MSNSRSILKSALNHENSAFVPVDFGATAVTGIHVKIVAALRKHFGLEEKPVKIHEPYQMLGEIDDELLEAMNIDVAGVFGDKNMFGFANDNWKEWKTPWGQDVLVGGDFNVTLADDGAVFMHPGGDVSLAPSAKLPAGGYFFDAIERQAPIDEAKLDPAENLEEFGYIDEGELLYWKKASSDLAKSGKGLVASFGGTALGDIALVPAMQLKNPRGIRGVSEWYMSTLLRRDYIHEVFDKQTDIALSNLQKLKEATGDSIDVVFICGTDFGTQDSQFCSPEDYSELYMPYYKKINNWIHQNTGWKTFKHSCGSVKPLMSSFIESGFDIINPVQINAADMDPADLKKEFGKDLVFWGGGIDTQVTLAFSSPEEVKKEVLRNCEIFSRDGGFVFNTVHNIQANVPLQNILAMLEGLNEFNH